MDDTDPTLCRQEPGGPPPPEDALEAALADALRASGCEVYTQAYCRGPHSAQRPMRCDLWVRYPPGSPLAKNGLPVIAFEVKSTGRAFAEVSEGGFQAAGYMGAYAWATTPHAATQSWLERPMLAVVATWSLLTERLEGDAVGMAERLLWRHGVTLARRDGGRLWCRTNASGSRQVGLHLLTTAGETAFAARLDELEADAEAAQGRP